MITTVTTVTTVTTIAALGLAAAISVAAVVSLIVLLIAKELAGAKSSGKALRITRFLGVGIVPLVLAFAVIVAVNVVLAL